MRWLMCALVLIGAGCSAGEWDRTDTERDYSAYGKTWHYTSIEHYRREWRVIDHFESINRSLVLTDDQGRTLSIEDRIYALQRDGSYEKASCCAGVYPSESGLYNFDGKLVLVLFQKRKAVTDCLVYPPGIPDNEQRDPGQQVAWVSFFGEYDPQKRAFYVHDFRGRRGEDSEIRKRDQGSDWRERLYEYYYSIRQPFICS
jgi:hypothetical protein